MQFFLKVVLSCIGILCLVFKISWELFSYGIREIIELIPLLQKCQTKTQTILNFLKFQQLPHELQKQLSRSVLRKRCREHIQQFYRRTSMPECGFNKVAFQLYGNLWHWCSSVNLLHIFRNLFYKNAYGGLLLKLQAFAYLSVFQPS